MKLVKRCLPTLLDKPTPGLAGTGPESQKAELPLGLAGGSPGGANIETMDTQPIDEVERRVVETRMKLRERWRARVLATRARSDPQPRGSGPANRHGMPQLPPGQKPTKKWPVLDLGRQPKIQLQEWLLTVDGACRRPLQLNWGEFQGLEQVEEESDFHCVTGWSKLDVRWKGVRFSELAALAGVLDEATHVICHGYDGYTTNLPLEEALKDDVLLVYEAEGQPLSREHGGPVRMVTPQLYAWKGTKWICRLEFRVGDELGYWERNGLIIAPIPGRKIAMMRPPGEAHHRARD